MTCALLTVLTFQQRVQKQLTASSLAKTKAGTPKDIRSNCIFHSYTFGKGKKQKAHLRIFSIKQQEINLTLS